MSELPPWLLSVPRTLYAAAVLFFVWSFGLTMWETSLTTGYAESTDPVVRLAQLRGLYQAALEGLYIAANGVIIHILLAIRQNGRRGGTGGGDS